MDKSYLAFLKMMETPPLERKAIRYKRKVKYEITAERLNVLVSTYFEGFDHTIIERTFLIEKTDIEDLLFLFRYHFRLWITIDNSSITVFRNIPLRFKIIKEVNRENHWFVPKTFEVGQIMYFKSHGYSSANWLNGIPLAESLTTVKNTDIIPTTQINYGFIEAL
jgi:hypothetical protein